MTRDKRPLRVLFLDLNAYFASVEQQERPELRNRPIAVVPVMADTSFVIAASYEAKRYGIKTGTQISEARRSCPEIELVDARPALYVGYHNRILEAAEAVLPIDHVHSIDEMSFRLLGTERTRECAVEIARRMKEAIREKVGGCLTCSIGIAPNSFLAKVATDMEKPNGLVVLESDQLPQRLHCLKLTEFAGINKKMEVRLNAAGIFTSEQMCDASSKKLASAFGSIVGERWWYLLRGYEVVEDHRSRKSLGHSHVLPPDQRHDEGCREVLLRLLHKAASRLRAEKLFASGMAIHVGGFRKSWTAKIKLPPTQDSVTMTEYFSEVWSKRDFSAPKMVGVTFFDLSTAEAVTLSLFDPTLERSLFNEAIDGVNQRFGKNKVFLAGMEHARSAAPERIAFNKTWLFSEGKGDNEIPGE